MYEGVASICRFEQNNERRMMLIDNLLLQVNENIAAVIKEGCANSQAFHQMEAIHLLRNSLRFHKVVCEVVRIDYYKQVSWNGKNLQCTLFLFKSKPILFVVFELLPRLC